MLGELHGKARNAAGAALDQNRLAGFDLRHVFDAGERGDADEAERRRFGMAERIRLLGEEVSLDRDLLGIGAFDALVEHAEHGIADFEIGDAGADLAHHAGKIAPQDVGKLRELVEAVAPPHLGIGAVDAGGVNIDHHFAGSRLRVRRLAVFQHLRAAVAH